MAISTPEVSDGGGFDHDPLHGLDFTTAMALLDSQLHQRLGEVAMKEQTGITGAIRLQLQRLWPKKFGAEITPERIGQLFRFIEHAAHTSVSHRDVPSWGEDDSHVHVYQEVRDTIIKWGAAELRGYLSEIDGHVRRRGSFAFVLADHDAEAEKSFKSTSSDEDGM
jgi:hypothetical protein